MAISGEWIQGCGVMAWRRVFPGRADQAAPARQFVTALLADTERADDAEWIAAEFISNALLHTRSGEHNGWFGVEVRRCGFALVAVHDLGGAGVPRLSTGLGGVDLCIHGRGLRGVNELAEQMGYHGNPSTGHTVWAQLTLEDSAQDQAS